MIGKIQTLFEKITEKVENNPTGFTAYLFLYFALLFIRLSLEFFSGQRLFTLYDIIHIGLWFTFIVMAFMLQLQIFSGERMLKISKLVITFFSIALTAPIIDLLIFQGQGVKMNYLSLNNWNEVIWSYFTIGGSSLTRGATPGIRIEIVLLVLASFNYVRTKRKSIGWGVIASFSIYTVLFLSGAFPAILGLIVNFFQLQYQTDDHSTILLLLCLDVFLIFIAFYRHYSTPVFAAITKAIPWTAIFLALFYFIIGMRLALFAYPQNWVLNPTTLFWFPLLFGLGLWFFFLLGIYQLTIKTSEPIRDFTGLKTLFFLLILVTASLISAHALFTVLLLLSLIFIQFEPPLSFFKIPFVRNFMFGFISLAFSFYGYATFKAPLVAFPFSWMILLFANAFLASFVLKTFGNFDISSSLSTSSKKIKSAIIISVFVLLVFTSYKLLIKLPEIW